MGHPPQSDTLPSYRDDVGEGRAAETASLHSAVSLHTYEETIEDADLPSYSDEAGTSAQDVHGILVDPSQGSVPTPWLATVEATRDQHDTAAPVFSKDPNALYDLLEFQSRSPPHPWVHFKGHHLEQQRQSDGKVKQQTVIDFAVFLDCTDQLTPGPDHICPVKWSTLYAIPDEVKTFRGFLCRRRAKKPSPNRPDLESGPNPTGPESRTRALKTWCHIFTSRASHSAFPYIFRLHRHVTNWDTLLLDDRLQAMIRATNYRGRLEFQVKTDGDSFTVYSDHWINRLRTNRVVYWVCIVLQLWILTWPVLLLCTGRFAVVRADWPYKKRRQDVDPSLRDGGLEYPGEVDKDYWYASMSENTFLETWGRVIVDAAFARRQGEVGSEDFRRVMQLMQAERENQTGGMERRRSSGNAVVDTAVGIMAGISGVRDERDRALGWGADDVDAGRLNLSVGGLSIGRNGLGRIRLG